MDDTAMSGVMMRCGCAAMTIETMPDGTTRPACFTHLGMPEAVEIDTEFVQPEGRTMRCAYGDKELPSDPAAAFFEYRGPGSYDAKNTCAAVVRRRDGTCGECRFAEIAHGEVNVSTGRPGITDHVFNPHGAFDQDRYYCGCFGWD